MVGLCIDVGTCNEPGDLGHCYNYCLTFSGFPACVAKCNEVMDAGYDGFVLEGSRATIAAPTVCLTDRWHVPLDQDVISPAMVAAKRVPVV